MKSSVSRRTFVASAMAVVAAPSLGKGAAAADAPLTLRCSLETAPSHTRNVLIKDYLGRIEAAAGGKIKTQLFESGQLFPDLQVGKALLQGQIEMAVPGAFALTGVVADADFFQLPALYGRPIEMIHRVVDGDPGKLLARDRTLARSWILQLVHHQQAAEFLRRPQGSENPQQRRRRASVAHAVHGRDPEHHAVAQRVARTFARHLRRSDYQP